MASKYRPASKLENFDFEIEINGVRDRFSALPSPRARVLPEEREREKERGEVRGRARYYVCCTYTRYAHHRYPDTMDP